MASTIKTSSRLIAAGIGAVGSITLTVAIAATALPSGPGESAGPSPSGVTSQSLSVPETFAGDVLVAADAVDAATALRTGGPGDVGSAVVALQNGDDDGGVPADSPACAKLGCSSVETPDGLVKNLPQPAVDGINRAKENRDAAGAGGNGDDDPDAAPLDLTDDAGVPADSPACANLGCASVETPGGPTKNLPQPAVDGINRAKANREAAQGNAGGGSDDSD